MQRTKTNETLRDLTAGTVGGIFQTVVGHPLDTVKVRIQAQNQNAEFKGPMDCIIKTFKNEGIRGFYKGATPPLFMGGFLNAVMFATNGQMKNIVHRDKSKPISKKQVVLAAEMTVPIYCAFLSPVDMVKNRLQIQMNSTTKLYNGPVDCVMKVLKSEGFKGLFKGFVTTCMMRSVGSPTYFLSYELCKNLLTKEGSPVSSLTAMVSGSFAGGMFWTVSYPLDQLKTRIQVQSEGSKSILDAAKELYHQGGLKRFYLGYTPCVARGIIANGFIFLGVEKTKNLWNKYL